MRQRPQFRHRDGFTILEMLIVCAIIMTLMGLTLGAVVRVKGVQMKLNTQWMLSKLDSAMHQHWNAVVNAANNEDITTFIQKNQGLVGSDAAAGKRARAIWVKLRLKQEFPMSFAEAAQPPPGIIPITLLAPKSSYSVLGTLTPQQHYVLVGSNKINVESAACLYLALQQNRNGTNTNVDTILSNREVKTIPGTQVKYIVDAFDTPVAFYRWPVANTDLNPKAGPKAANQTENLDPEDPDGLLAMSTWKGQGQFGGLCYPITPNQTLRLEPVVVSAGPDRQFGLDSLDSGAPPTTMAPTNAQNSYDYPPIGDNLYTYNVRKFGRGD